MIRLENVLKISLQDVLKTSWRYLEDAFGRRLEDVLKTSWRRLEDVRPRWIYWSWPRRLEDVFWRRKAKANILVLIKTSSEDEDERRFQDVFIKTNVCWEGACDRSVNFSHVNVPLLFLIKLDNERFCFDFSFYCNIHNKEMKNIKENKLHTNYIKRNLDDKRWIRLYMNLFWKIKQLKSVK